jgi:hypothetical protein
LIFLVPQEGFEPPTPSLRMRYGTVTRPEKSGHQSVENLMLSFVLSRIVA